MTEHNLYCDVNTVQEDDLQDIRTIHQDIQDTQVRAVSCP